MSNFQIQPRIAQYRRRYEPAEAFQAFVWTTKGVTFRHASALKPGDADGTDISVAMSVHQEHGDEASDTHCGNFRQPMQ